MELHRLDPEGFEKLWLTLTSLNTTDAKYDNSDDELAGLLKDLANALSPQEEGLLLYQAHQDPQNPRVFFFYEQYRDEAAYQAHVESEHFKRWGFGVGIIVPPAFALNWPSEVNGQPAPQRYSILNANGSAIGSLICTVMFCSVASCRNSFTARCFSI